LFRQRNYIEREIKVKQATCNSLQNSARRRIKVKEINIRYNVIQITSGGAFSRSEWDNYPGETPQGVKHVELDGVTKTVIHPDDITLFNGRMPFDRVIEKITGIPIAEFEECSRFMEEPEFAPPGAIELHNKVEKRKEGFFRIKFVMDDTITIETGHEINHIPRVSLYLES